MNVIEMALISVAHGHVSVEEALEAFDTAGVHYTGQLHLGVAFDHPDFGAETRRANREALKQLLGRVKDGSPIENWTRKLRLPSP